MTDEETVPLSQHSLALELRNDPVKGRGVFTKDIIASNTLVEISPVLLFNPTEYANHGKHTILDHYTYCWPGGYYGLALGLGSMFNHNSTPNVGFIRDFNNKLIRYVTLREIQPEEELCISYGNHLWFEDDDSAPALSDSEEELFPFQDDDDELCNA
ncbi:protein methyltransferase [Backusella circina FSU 941]|nr:protein methyltransferase [Backusella circina FSU 941]